MNHPQPEEWLPFLDGEASPQDRQRLSQHLAECPECAREIDAWRRTLRQLDRWTLPKAPGLAAPWLAPVKWALAASVVLAVGVVLGSLRAPNDAQLAELRVQIEASVRSSLQAQVDEALDGLETGTAERIHALESRLARASAAENDQLWRAVLGVLSSARAEDARTVQAGFEQLQRRTDARFVGLRRDLETLASATDEEIRLARHHLIQLASGANALEN